MCIDADLDLITEPVNEPSGYLDRVADALGYCPWDALEKVDYIETHKIGQAMRDVLKGGVA